MRSEDSVEKAITNSWPATRSVWRTRELGWGAFSSSLALLQFGGVFFSRASRRDSSACCAELRRGVLRVDALADWGARFAGAGELASGDSGGEAAGDF